MKVCTLMNIMRGKKGRLATHAPLRLDRASSLSEKSLSCPESRVLAVFKGIFTPKQPLFRQKDRGSGLLRQPARSKNGGIGAKIKVEAL